MLVTWGSEGARWRTLGPRPEPSETLSAVLPRIKPLVKAWDADAWDAPANGPRSFRRNSDAL